MLRASRVRSLLLPFVAASTLALGTACGDDGSPTGGNAVGTLTAKIDGADFNSTLSVTAVNSNGVIAIAGIDGAGRQIQLRVLGLSAPGTVTIGGVASTSFALFASGATTWQSNLVSGTGSITFSTLSATKAVGTFTFNAQPSPGTAATGVKAVTSGAFDVKF